MMNHHFDPADFMRFLDRWPNYADAYNEPLYLLFGLDREHAAPDTTKAKFEFVDLIYKTRLGEHAARARKRNNKLKPISEADPPETRSGPAILWLAEQVQGSQSFHDLVAMAELASGLTADTRTSFAGSVPKFAALIRVILKNQTGDGPISFCSKYLHFHSRAHPVFDRDASSALYLIFNELEWGSLLQRRAEGEHPWEGRLRYEQLCEMEWELLRCAFPGKESYSREVKQLDHYLIACYRKEWPEA